MSPLHAVKTVALASVFALHQKQRVASMEGRMKALPDGMSMMQ